MSVPPICPAIRYTKTLFLCEFSKINYIYFLKSISGNMSKERDFEKNVFWSGCLYAKNDFLKFYVMNGTDRQHFWPYHSIQYTVSFQKIYVSYGVQFIALKSSRRQLCKTIQPATYILSIFFICCFYINVAFLVLPFCILPFLLLLFCILPFWNVAFLHPSLQITQPQGKWSEKILPPNYAFILFFQYSKFAISMIKSTPKLVEIAFLIIILK